VRRGERKEGMRRRILCAGDEGFVLGLVLLDVPEVVTPTQARKW
jgi:hypothetical protein